MTPLEKLHRDKFPVLVAAYTSRAGSRSNAEDVVQQAFLNACQGLKTFDPSKATMPTWFNTVLERTFYRWLTKERFAGMTSSIDDLEIEDCRVDLDKLVLYNDIRGHITSSTNGKKRVALLGFFILGLSIKECCERTGLSVNSVKGHLKRYRDLAKRRFT